MEPREENEQEAHFKVTLCLLAWNKLTPVHLTRREGKCWTCPPSQKKVNFSYRKRKITFFNRRSLTSCSCFLRPGKISFLMRKRNWVEKQGYHHSPTALVSGSKFTKQIYQAKIVTNIWPR